MAVDARHLNLLLPQLISTRELYYPNQGNVMSAYNDGQMGGCLGVTSTPDCVLPSHHQSLVCESLQPKTSMNTDSGLTCNAVPAPRKRSRDCFDNTSLISNTNYACPQKNAFSQYPPIGVTFVSQLQQCQLEIDALVSQHTKKMRMEIEERQKQHARLIVQALGEGLMKKLKEKDEQIQKIGKLNMILQERVKSLYVENQLWRDLAQTNEATANNLRTNLEQVLAHVSDERFSSGGGMGAVEEDVQSCCGSSSSSDDRGIEEEEVEGRRRLAAAAGGEAQDERCMVATEAHGKVKCGRMCRVCGERESCVLLLPCRHLCLCTLCGSSLLQTCPVCNSNMNATVHVNTSSSS